MSVEPKEQQSSRNSGGLSPLVGWAKKWLDGHTQWIFKNSTWPKLKPVIRCAVIAWVSVVFFVIPKIENLFGTGSFLLLIAVFLAPPSDPFVAVLKRQLLIVFFATLAWAWTCLALFLANLARRVHDPTATLQQAATGMFVEAAPSAVYGVFIFFGIAFFLYIKASHSHGPFFFATVFACICLDLSFTTVVIYPYPFYEIGKSIVLPLAFSSALSVFGSIVVFPSSVSAQFTARLQGVLTPLISALDNHRTLLNTPFPIQSDSSSMDLTKYTEKVTAASNSIKASETALGALAATAGLMKSDLIYGRFSPMDFKAFQMMCRRMSGRANGLAAFFSLTGVGPGSDSGMGALRTTANTPSPDTPVDTALAGPSTSSFGDLTRANIPVTHASTHSLHSRSKSTLHQDRSHSHIQLPGPHSRLHYDKPQKGQDNEYAVGIFENQRYYNMEATKFWDPNKEHWTRKSTQTLGESCDTVLEVSREGLIAVKTWLGNVRQGRLTYLFGIRRKERDEQIADKIKQMKALRTKISSALALFRTEKRLLILDPYRPEFKSSTRPPKSDPHGDIADIGVKINPDLFDQIISDDEFPMPHKYLFRSYFYQYHLIQVCSIVIEMLDEIIKLEEKRTRDRLWTPIANIFTWQKVTLPDDPDKTEDEDPDVIQGLERDLENEDREKSLFDAGDLGIPRVRDPDALPPRNWAEWVMARGHNFITGLGGGNLMFAIKGGILTVLLCLPSFFTNTAKFAYENKFIWAIFVSQLNLSRFRGETAFGLITRLSGTFFGAFTGAVMWYISCGPERGNAYGFAAVCGVCFPFFYFVRLYAPIPMMANTLYFVTIALVIGYSYQDIRIVQPNSPGFGLSVAWRRLLLVFAAVMASFLASHLPPTTSVRKYHRRLLATTSAQLGTAYCAILSFAGTKDGPEVQEIISCLLAIRMKLKHSAAIRSNIDYEFSFRGRWPKERYHRIMELQVGISHSLANLISVLEHLEPIWARAFLKRTRFMDPDFQGDVLAVISMISSALRTGTPVPQITPCPLLDRFLIKDNSKEAMDNYGLPRSTTFESLKNEQYLMFSVGVTTAFGIVKRLDQLMIATKEVVGEHYHIHGVGGASANPFEKGSLSTQLRPPGDNAV